MYFNIRSLHCIHFLPLCVLIHSMQVHLASCNRYLSLSLSLDCYCRCIALTPTLPVNRCAYCLLCIFCVRSMRLPDRENSKNRKSRSLLQCARAGNLATFQLVTSQVQASHSLPLSTLLLCFLLFSYSHLFCSVHVNQLYLHHVDDSVCRVDQTLALCTHMCTSFNDER